MGMESKQNFLLKMQQILIISCLSISVFNGISFDELNSEVNRDER